MKPNLNCPNCSQPVRNLLQHTDYTVCFGVYYICDFSDGDQPLTR